MRYQKLGNTGLFVSRLCLGTMTLAAKAACGENWSVAPG
jgi:aryl-alcohol dehydrogenase-like predicted oxidoreductase